MDLRKSEKADDDHRVKNKKNKKRKNMDESNQLQQNERKKSKQELMSKMREEVFFILKNDCVITLVKHIIGLCYKVTLFVG